MLTGTTACSRWLIDMMSSVYELLPDDNTNPNVYTAILSCYKTSIGMMIDQRIHEEKKKPLRFHP